MLTARALLWMQYRRLHDLVVNFVARQSCVGAIPGVGPVTALSFVTAIDDPSRFRRLRDVAACSGLTSRGWQSGTSIDVRGHTCGDTSRSGCSARVVRGGVGADDAL